jgi:peroxiredoxin
VAGTDERHGGGPRNPIVIARERSSDLHALDDAGRSQAEAEGVTVARIDDLHVLPPELPVPSDDGACDHLPGSHLPAIALPATDGTIVDLAALPGRTVVYCYPRTGRPDQAVPPGWNALPGARGCTPQSCAYRDHHAELAALGARVFGLSSQDSAYPREAAERLHLPFPLLSDAELRFARALTLPTFVVSAAPELGVLIRRLTLIIGDGRIEHVFYPVFPPDADAARVVAYLAAAG